MAQSFNAILPIIFVFLFGYLLKITKQFSDKDGSTLLKLVFFAGSPALVFLSIINSEIDISFVKFIFFPLFMLICMLIPLFLLRKSFLSNVDIKAFSAMAIGILLMNTGFLLPFVEVTYGREGLARLILIDLAMNIVAFTLVYGYAVKVGGKDVNSKYIAKKLIISPPIWTLILALIIKYLDIETPATVIKFFETLAKLVSPTILLALGLKFTPRLKNLNLISFSLFCRFILGGLLGYLFVVLFSMDGLDAVIVMLVSMAPFGFNTITFSDLEKLDSEYAAIQVSAGLALAMFTMPFIIEFLNKNFL
jgi:predicted permease